jgi:hypothetical protein
MKGRIVFVSALAVVACTLLAGGLAAQGVPAALANANVQQRPVPSGLEQAFRGLVSAQQGPAWIAYSVPAVPGNHHSCDSEGRWHDGVVRLEPGRDRESTAHSRVSLEGPSEILVFFRAEQGRVGRIRVVSPDCEIDGGGLTVHWLTQVSPAESVALLSSLVGDLKRAAGEASGRGALAAIALHRDPSALAPLRRFVASGQPAELRKQAAFWLAAVRGREGFDTIRGLLDDKDPAFRAELTFPVYVSKEAESADILVRMARSDESPKVRRQALFWLGQKAGTKALATLEGAIENDPDTEVKKRAVFALSQMPKDEGVPRLVEVARTHRNPEVRRQAMFWLGQSNDPRALAFFEAILKR